MRIYAEAYGCTLNKSEAGELIRAARSHGHTLTSDPRKASIVVLATCVVIDTTERKMLRRLAALSRSGIPVMIIGCMSTARPAVALRTCPRAVLIPPGDVQGALNLLDRFERTSLSRPNYVSNQIEPPKVKDAVRPPFCDDGAVICPIPIASGCRGACTYCITQRARGNLRSRPISRVLGEAREAIKAGAREIQLCAQDSATYGLDNGESLPELLVRAASLKGNFMLRVGMMNPASLSPIRGETITAFDNPKVYKFLHLPIQSGDDDILRAMGRAYNAQDVENQVAMFRRRFPELTLSTDVIVGFPGETERAHQNTVAILERLNPDIVNVTRFSPRPGTRAFEIIGAPRGSVTKARSRELTVLRFKIALSKNMRLIGKRYHVLATEKGKGTTILARTPSYKQVVIRGWMRLGEFAGVEIVGATRINLEGKLT
jgi:threonylcarbamoyladenosine tRNA methylthiotransferase CDKAL1